MVVIYLTCLLKFDSRFFVCGSRHPAPGILLPQPGMESVPPEAQVHDSLFENCKYLIESHLSYEFQGLIQLIYVKQSIAIVESRDPDRLLVSESCWWLCLTLASWLT